jgi:pSer/pThr/pTyr-binding forkhead associated (FHA) protein
MKYFKCGQCHSPYKIDETKVNNSVIMIKCTQCSAGNIVRFGPVLVAQSKDQTQQFSLKVGENTLGRKSETSISDFKINDSYISKSHAKIFIEEKDGKLYFFIMDTKSTNGTFNRNKIKLKSDIKYPFTIQDYYIMGLTKLSIKFT